MKLHKVEINAYGGISPDSPVILDFTEANWIKLIGDNFTGKTSTIDAMLTGLAQKSKDDKDKINLDSKKIEINYSFTGNDRRLYEVHVTKSKLDLKYSGESIPEPVTMIRELVGPVGTTPMIVKEAKLTDVIKWLAAYSNTSAEDFEKKMTKFKESLKLAEASRADANRSLKGLNEFLNSESMYNDWEGSEKKYKVKPDIQKLSLEQQEAGKKSDQLIRAQEKLKQKIERKEAIIKQIAELQAELMEVGEAVALGTEFVEKNKNAGKEYDEVSKRYKSAAQDLADYNLWQDIKKKKKERDEFETMSQQFDAKAKSIIQQRKEAQAEILPDIKGVELYTEDSYEDGVSIKEGLYYEGKNVRQLSETAWWGLVMQIWRKFKVKIIIIDNYQSLGSYGEELLKKLAKDGAYILTAEMDRKTKELTISYE